MNNVALNNWYPISLNPYETDIKCKWKYFKGIEFTDPFFNETISRAYSLEINSKPYKVLSDLDVLPGWAPSNDNIEPALFIFHVSRCGSTLLTQLLNLDAKHIVLSEVPFIDDILKQLPIDEWLINVEYQKILKAAIKLYGRKFNPEQSKLFIKLDSWHLYYLPLFRLLYPSAPFLLLYRKPDEVLLSQQKKRGMHAVPGLINNRILGVETDEHTNLSFDLHMIKVLESYFESMIGFSKNDELAILANYDEGIGNIVEKFSEFLALDLDENYRNKILERSQYHAKFPDQHFTEETPKEIFTANLNSVLLLYNELEKSRSLQTLKIKKSIEA